MASVWQTHQPLLDIQRHNRFSYKSTCIYYKSEYKRIHQYIFVTVTMVFMCSVITAKLDIFTLVNISDFQIINSVKKSKYKLIQTKRGVSIKYMNSAAFSVIRFSFTSPLKFITLCFPALPLSFLLLFPLLDN